MPKIFSPISYDKSKTSLQYLWQHKLDKLLERFKDSYVDFKTYQSVIDEFFKSEMDNNSYNGRKYFGWGIEDENDKREYVEGVMLYDYITFQYMNYGEHVFYLMPKLCENLLSKVNCDREIDLEQWRVPYPICYFKFPDDLICCEVGKGTNSKMVEVEGCFVEEIYDGEVKIDKRIGIRLLLIDKNGEMLGVFENYFKEDGNAAEYEGAKRKCNVSDVTVINEVYVLIDRVLEYIAYIMDRNNDVRQEEEVSATEEAIRSEVEKVDGVSVRKKRNGFKGLDGVNVVVIAEKIKRKHPMFQNMKRCLTVKHDVVGHWRHLNNDRYTVKKGQRVWVKACKRGVSNESRVVTVYQVGRK